MRIKRFSLNKATILLPVIFLVFFIPRIIALGSDMANIDTMYWYPRMEKFPRKVLQADFKATYQQYHPGTTLLWVSGFAKYSFEKAFEAKYGYNPAYIPHHFLKIQFVSTFPLVFLISVLGTICFWIIWKLENLKLATIFSIVLSLEPFFLGISKYLHLTALSIMFGFTAYLLVVYYLKHNQKKWLILAGILQGLALSTKISVLILTPITGLLVLAYLLPNKFEIKSIFNWIKRSTIINLTVILISAITFFAINPFMWVAPTWGLNKIYKEGIVNTGFGGNMPDTMTNSQYLYYFETAFVRTTPILFVAFLAGIALYFYRIKRTRFNALFTSAILLFVLYYLSLSIPSKLKDRYYVELMPSVLLIGSYAIYSLLNKLHSYKQWMAIGAYVIYMGIVLYSYYPSFSFYHTEAIGGPNGLYSQGIRPTNRGEWYGEAAQFLNTQDEKPETKIVLMGNESLVRTFAPFYYGTTYADLGAIPDKKGLKVHYIVTRNSNQKYVPQDKCPFLKAFGSKGPFAFDNVFIFKCENMPKEELSKLIPTFPDY